MDQIASHSPHDAVFKHLLSHRATARDFLLIHLPEYLRVLCDLRTLQLESGINFSSYQIYARENGSLSSCREGLFSLF